MKLLTLSLLIIKTSSYFLVILLSLKPKIIYLNHRHVGIPHGRELERLGDLTIDDLSKYILVLIFSIKLYA